MLFANKGKLEARKQVSISSGLPPDVVASLFANGWAYVRTLNAPDRWVKDSNLQVTKNE